MRSSSPELAHDCCFEQSCSESWIHKVTAGEFARKIFLALAGILLAYLIVWVGTLIRNNIERFEYIGQAEKPIKTITLEAQAKVTATPDIAMTSLGVISQGATVSEAQQKNTEAMNNAIQKLAELGIEKKDIQTSNYSVSPRYTYPPEGERQLTGYEVSNTVTVKIRDLAKANQVLALAGELGLNNVGGLSFTIDDRDVYMAEARDEALRKVYEKANHLAKKLGVSITEIVSYNEYEGGNGPYPLYGMGDMMMKTEAAPQIEPGTNDVVMNVSVTFEIE